MRAQAAAALLLLVLVGSPPAHARPLRILSLDQCADQYVLALAPEADLALSPRADDPDAFLRQAAQGRRRVRPTLEAAIAFRPDVVVRYWGGEPRLLHRLDRAGVRVVSIQDAADFDGVARNIADVAAGLGAEARGAALVAEMRAKIARTPSAGPAPTALYLTAGGFTAGAGTMIDAILRAAGFRNAAPTPGFAPVSVERIALSSPARFVLGFFDQTRADWRGAGRHPVVRRAAAGRVAGDLPAAVLTCPAWFSADAVQRLKTRG